MNDRDKVISRLQIIRTWAEVGKNYDGIQGDGCLRDIVDWIDDALVLLKEQEPRVLTLEEVEDLPYGHVLIETDKSDSLRWLDALLFCKNTNYSFDFITLEGRARLLGTEYNREWRCWSAKPTDEQREAVPWMECQS